MIICLSTVFLEGLLEIILWQKIESVTFSFTIRYIIHLAVQIT